MKRFPFLTQMPKITKHTFEFPNIVVKDGELVEDGVIRETYTFTLLHRGVGIFEELSKKPLMSYLLEMKTDDDEVDVQKVLNKEFIQNLACASYVKIVNDQFHNNRSTAEEFKKTRAFNKCTEDIEFIEKLITMASDCITSTSVMSSKRTKTTKKS